MHVTAVKRTEERVSYKDMTARLRRHFYCMLLDTPRFVWHIEWSRRVWGQLPGRLRRCRHCHFCFWRKANEREKKKGYQDLSLSYCLLNLHLNSLFAKTGISIFGNFHKEYVWGYVWGCAFQMNENLEYTIQKFDIWKCIKMEIPVFCK